MRYSTTHKEQTRNKLLESSRTLAKRGGFGATGVDALMAAVGLSGGAFYNHFDSKEDLFAELIACEVENSAHMLAGGDDDSVEHIRKSLRRYLSVKHARHPESGCVLPSLGAEIARAQPAVRATVENALKKVQQRWKERLDDDGDAAWALMAQCVGAIVLARAVKTDSARQEILAAARRLIEKELE
jgi:AcrR family transcriptional regulator